MQTLLNTTIHAKTGRKRKINMFGFWKKKYEETSRKLSEETEIKEMFKRRLSEQMEKADEERLLQGIRNRILFGSVLI